jgi:hypothetical protein
VSLGGVRNFKIADHLALRIGDLVAVNFVPDRLRDEYGGQNSLGATGFLQLKIE